MGLNNWERGGGFQAISYISNLVKQINISNEEPIRQRDFDLFMKESKRKSWKQLLKASVHSHQRKEMLPTNLENSGPDSKGIPCGYGCSQWSQLTSRHWQGHLQSASAAPVYLMGCSYRPSAL